MSGPKRSRHSKIQKFPISGIPKIIILKLLALALEPADQQHASMSFHKLTTILLFIVGISYGVLGQDTTHRSPYCIDVNKVPLSFFLSDKYLSTTYIANKQDLVSTYQDLVFQNGRVHKGLIPNDYVTKRPVIRFTVCNSADTTITAWFFPGIHFRNILLYRQQGPGLAALPTVSPDNPDGISYRRITLAAHDSALIVAELHQVKTYLNKVTPRLISDRYLPYFISGLHDNNSDSNLVTYLFCGLLLMLILYSLANYFQETNKEFLYYSGYAFFLGIMLFAKAIYTWRTTHISFFQEEYLDFVMQSVGHLFYMAFMQQFLATRKEHPFLHRLYNCGIAMLIISMLGYSYVYFLTTDFVFQNGLENLTKILLLLMVLIFLFYSLRHWKDKLLRYLFWGNLCLFIFSLLSQLNVMAPALSRALPGILSNSLFYYEIGLFLELVFFLAGLNHKNRRQLIGHTRERERLKAENQMKEYEKELAVFKAQQEERERISADMHDELGSGMTAIRLMSEIARNKMKENTPVEIEKISHSADEVLNKMNAIIWSMNSGNDTVDNLISYIRSYALEYFENTPIYCRVYIPERIDKIEVSGDKRRNIFLCVKETLNNAMKHSGATELKINIAIKDKLEIFITDNGVGIDLQRLRQFGNGLKNIAKRMESIGGSYKIENQNGTITILSLPL
jgi:signal transduction histidine kinase